MASTTKLVLFAALCLYSVAARCPAGAVQGLNERSCYKIYANTLTWVEAEGRCIAENGHLASVASVLTNSFLAKVTGTTASSVSYWLGGAWNAQQSGAWSWSDGSKWSYTNWGPGQPIKGPVCLAFNVTTGKWQSEDCNRAKSYICQVSSSNHDGGASPPPNLPTPPPPDRCPAGWIYLPDTNLCYAVKSGSNDYSWNNGQTLCSGYGAGLVSIPNFSINAAVLTYGLNAQVSDAYMVIGYSYNSTASKWQWVDGSAASYSNWGSGQPNSPDTYSCAFMKITAPGIGQWYTGSCYSQDYAVICERESFDI